MKNKYFTIDGKMYDNTYEYLGVTNQGLHVGLHVNIDIDNTDDELYITNTVPEFDDVLVHNGRLFTRAELRAYRDSITEILGG